MEHSHSVRLKLKIRELVGPQGKCSIFCCKQSVMLPAGKVNLMVEDPKISLPISTPFTLKMNYSKALQFIILYILKRKNCINHYF